MHGYDIVDHGEINPELGGEEGFARFSDALREHGLGLVLDIVPNHMGVGGADNAWWLSVLEWGELSPHRPPSTSIGSASARTASSSCRSSPTATAIVLEKGDLEARLRRRGGSFSVWHCEHRFPVSPLSYPIVLDRALAALGAPSVPARGHLRDQRASAHHERGDVRPIAARLPGRERAAEAATRRAWRARSAMRGAIERACTSSTARAAMPESFGTLHRILEAQAYRLAYWRVAASDINYRRFFDINGLAGLRVEDPEVFERKPRDDLPPHARGAHPRACASTISTGLPIRTAICAPAGGRRARLLHRRREDPRARARSCAHGRWPARPATSPQSDRGRVHRPDGGAAFRAALSRLHWT